MKYIPKEPNITGLVQLFDINLRDIVPFINWKFFFQAWKLSGKYDGIENLCDCSSCKANWLLKFPVHDREKPEEALKLYRDAQNQLLGFLVNQDLIHINAVFGIFPAFSKNEDIIIKADSTEIVIPTLRQQLPSRDGFCYSLSDFVDKTHDFLGIFSVTVLGIENLALNYEQDGDIYNSLLIKSLGDRLVEATSEWLHFQIRKKYWGYNPEEDLDVELIMKNNYPGIRPAVGYPSLPDQSVIFELNSILHLENVGISLTENGAMIPNSSVCGLYFAHPSSKYFMIGKIDAEQLFDYAVRRDKTPEEMKRWLYGNI